MSVTSSNRSHWSYERTTPRLAESGSPKFTEHFNAAPPYQPYPPDRSNDAELDEFNLGHRLSNKERHISPSELGSTLPEFVIPEHQEKEVAVPAIQPSAYQRPPEESARRSNICGIPRKWLYLPILLLLLIAVGLGVGLGVGLTRHRHSPIAPAQSHPAIQDTEYAIGGALDPAYYSTSGAFNGSGIALASQSFASDLSTGTHGSIVAYFQHWTGQIRWMQLSNGGSWAGGDFSTVVALDAKNNTPLSAVSYVSNGSSIWHIFYVDKDDLIKQRTNSNTTNVWKDGPINQLNLTVNAADQVGMQACWYGDDYGDSDYTHTPLPGDDSVQANQDVGMHLWYASNATTFQQYGWRDGDESWELQGTWLDKNGHAGVGCYSWGPGTVTYVMFVNLQNTVEFWWKDTNTSLTSTNFHPINQWTNTSIAINNVYPSTSLGYTNVFYSQMANSLRFEGFNVSWAAENTSFITDDQFTVNDDQGVRGLPGTHLSVTAIPSSSGGNDLLVFYQTNGTDITEYTRDFVAGQWSSLELPIPQT